MSACNEDCSCGKDFYSVLEALTPEIESLKKHKFKTYILQKDQIFFGIKIPKGAKYKQQKNLDWYTPNYNGYICPSYQLHFTVVQNNPLFVLQE